MCNKWLFCVVAKYLLLLAICITAWMVGFVDLMCTGLIQMHTGQMTRGLITTGCGIVIFAICAVGAYIINDVLDCE